MSADTYTHHEFPKPKPLCGNWLAEGNIAMLYGWRGTGKTWVADTVAMCVATGQPFMGWTTHQAPVLYVDAEMPNFEQQQRLLALMRGMGLKPVNLGQLYILNHSFFERGLPDLGAGRKGWDMLRSEARGCKLVILDNLSSLMRFGDENDASSWTHVSEQLIAMRRLGIATLIVHHGGKPRKDGKRGDQRGTSRREDIMDTVVALEGVSHEDNVTMVKWEFTKSRAFFPGKPFKFEIASRDNMTQLQRCDAPPDEDLAEITALRAEGKSLRQIAKDTGISHTSVRRKLKGNEIPDRQL